LDGKTSLENGFATFAVEALDNGPSGIDEHAHTHDSDQNPVRFTVAEYQGVQ
jgi:hypothetical protein